MDLKTLQTQFMAALGTANRYDLAVRAWIEGDTRLSAAQRINIYRGSIEGNFIGILQAAFPVCLQLVGKTFFNALCKKFIATHQNQCPDVTLYGDLFPAFIKSFPAAHQQVPYLFEVAELEWACHLAMDSPEYSDFDVQALASVPEHRQGDLVFHCPPKSSLISARFPILAIWRRHQPGQVEEPIELDQSQDKLIVFRRDWTLWLHPLDNQTFDFLQAVKKGLCFARLTQELIHQYPGRISIPEILKESVRHGWISHFSLAS